MNQTAPAGRHDSEGADTHVDAVIIGAGIAGLNAARALLRAGHSVSAHEARDRVGGRLLSIPSDPSSRGSTVDLGATWFWPGQPQVQNLAEELGVATFQQSLAGDAMFEADARGVQRISGNPIDVYSGRFTSGAQSLAQRLAEQMPAGVLRLGDPVTAVHVTGDRVLVRARSGEVSASHVVLALPPALVVDSIILTPGLPSHVQSLAANTTVWMGSVVKAVAVYDRPFWRDAGLAGAAISYRGPFRELHDHSGPDGTAGAIFGFAGSEHFPGATDEQIATVFTGQLARLLGPNAGRPRAVHVLDWSRERYTSPTAVSARAPTNTYSHPQLREPVQGRLHFASTETASNNAGHIEGAIGAGRHAAATISQLLRPAPAAAAS